MGFPCTTVGVTRALTPILVSNPWSSNTPIFPSLSSVSTEPLELAKPRIGPSSPRMKNPRSRANSSPALKPCFECRTIPGSVLGETDSAIVLLSAFLGFVS